MQSSSYVYRAFCLTFPAAETEPKVAWSKDGTAIKIKKKDKRIKQDWDILDDTYFLQVKESTTKDSGMYTVIISNTAGKTEASVEVTVNAPKIEEPKKEVLEEKTAMDEAAVACDAPLKAPEPVKEPEPTPEEPKKPEPQKIEPEPEPVPKPKFQYSPKSVRVEEGDLIRLAFKLMEGIPGLDPCCET